MASSAPKIAEEERYEAPDEVDRKAQTLANQIKKSKYFITVTGIPDFRGPEGAWTLRAQGRQRTSKAVSTLQAIPTPTHMALVELQHREILKYLVSQNYGGLHRKSGMLPDRISELHGNSNREYCKDCGKEYIRDFRAVATYEKTVRDHRTGRKCTRCGGVLHDSIVNFGEYLPAQPLQHAYDHAEKADLYLVLGSSLTIPPANRAPEVVGQKKGAKLAICNLQTTPLDQLSNLRIYSRTDDLMIRVMEKLNIQIPPFILHRRLIIKLETNEDKRHQLTVHGVDVDGTPFSFLRSVKLASNRRVARSEPFVFNFRGDLDSETQLKFELEFMGHYGEPNLEIIHEYKNQRDTQTLHLLEYNPHTREWKASKQSGEDTSLGSAMTTVTLPSIAV